jgi:hypothetical protein
MSVAQAELPKAVPDNEQEAVLVEVVKFAENPEQTIPTLVRLDRLDETCRVRVHSLYFALKLGHVFGGSLIKRKGRSLIGGATVCFDQLPSQMVETGPQMLNSLPGNHRQLDWRLCPDLNPKNSISGLRVLLAQDAIWVGFAKGSNPAFEITDVVFGPFDFCPDAS